MLPLFQKMLYFTGIVCNLCVVKTFRTCYILLGLFALYYTICFYTIKGNCFSPFLFVTLWYSLPCVADYRGLASFSLFSLLKGPLHNTISSWPISTWPSLLYMKTMHKPCVGWQMGWENMHVHTVYISEASKWPNSERDAILIHKRKYKRCVDLMELIPVLETVVKQSSLPADHLEKRSLYQTNDIL